MKKMIEIDPVVLNQLSKSLAELVGASRFFNNDSVTEEALIFDRSERCKKAVRGTHVLAIQDTSEINYQSHRGKLNEPDKELGPVGNNKDIGFFIHPSVCWIGKMDFRLSIADVYIRDWGDEYKHHKL